MHDSVLTHHLQPPKQSCHDGPHFGYAKLPVLLLDDLEQILALQKLQNYVDRVVGLVD